MRVRLALPLLLVLLAVPATASAQSNPWLERRVLDIAHQGGEDEYPSNTMYAFRKSLEAGADAQGSIRMWREHDGWVDVAVGLGRGDSVFLPADMVDLDAGDVEIRLDSTKRKRRTKMKKCVPLSLPLSLLSSSLKHDD